MSRSRDGKDGCSWRSALSRAVDILHNPHRLGITATRDHTEHCSIAINGYRAWLKFGFTPDEE